MESVSRPHVCPFSIPSRKRFARKIKRIGYLHKSPEILIINSK